MKFEDMLKISMPKVITTPRNQSAFQNWLFRTGGLTGFERAVGLGGVLQGEVLVDAELDRAGDHGPEQILGGGDQVLALADVGVERGARQEERALGREHADVEAGTGPVALPKLTMSPRGAGSRASSRRCPCRRSRTRPAPLRPPVIPFTRAVKSSCRVEDGVAAPLAARQLRLLGVAHRADDDGAERLRPLAGDEAHAAAAAWNRIVSPAFTG